MFLLDFFSKPFGFMSCFLHKHVCSHFKCLKIYKFLDILDFYWIGIGNKNHLRINAQFLFMENVWREGP